MSFETFFDKALGGSLAALKLAINSNTEFSISAKGVNIAFSFIAVDGNGDRQTSELLVDITQGNADVTTDAHRRTTAFALSASAQQWYEMLQPNPKPPFQSYWGVLRHFSTEPSCGILGDQQAFCQHARIWRLVLDELRHTASAVARPEAAQLRLDPTLRSGTTEVAEEEEEDYIIGKYLWLTEPEWGRTKLFYETSGTGQQIVLFLHTAGSDGRQYHEVMNDPSLRTACTMYVFDLPGHGRSYPGSLQLPGGHVNSESRYVGIIAAFLRAKGLSRVIVSGASMGGHICLALAMRAAELSIVGVVPCEASAYMPFVQPSYETGENINEAILNPERVCGMIGPSASASRRKLIWWSYSSQAVGIFQGDLAFYFNGWDGRSRLALIDTAICPVYMLTGEYDYSCTPAESERTAALIPGANFEMMNGVGHFPATEDPPLFIRYFHKALEHIKNAGKVDSSST